jgi:hypothetical protein
VQSVRPEQQTPPKARRKLMSATACMTRPMTITSIRLRLSGNSLGSVQRKKAFVAVVGRNPTLEAELSSWNGISRPVRAMLLSPHPHPTVDIPKILYLIYQRIVVILVKSDE